jgi:hypothetical protein
MLWTQKAVIANLDRRVSGGHLRRAAKQCRAGVVEPLVEVLKGSQCELRPQPKEAADVTSPPLKNLRAPRRS